MRYYIKTGDDLVELPGFNIVPGTVDSKTGRRSGDRFAVQIRDKLDTTEGLVVLDETGMIYDCLVSDVSASRHGQGFQVQGVITKTLMAPDRAAALKAIKETQEGGKR